MTSIGLPNFLLGPAIAYIIFLHLGYANGKRKLFRHFRLRIYPQNAMFVCFPPFRVSSKLNEVNANAMAENKVRAELLVGRVGEGSGRAHKCKFDIQTNISPKADKRTESQMVS